MRSTGYGRTAELQDVYGDLARALGAAVGDASVEDRVGRLWHRAVLRFTAGDVDPTGIPAAVTPDPAPPPGFDVEGCLEHVTAAVASGAGTATMRAQAAAEAPLPGAVPEVRLPAAAAGSSVGRLSVRTAALLWVAVAVVFGGVLGVTLSGPVALPAFVPPIVTGLLAAFVGAGRGAGAWWAVGLAPLALLLPGAATSWLAVAVFVLLVGGFGAVLWLAAPWARRRPLELGLVLYSLAALTAPTDVVAVVFVCCAGALLWRRRWTALVTASVCVFIALGPAIISPAADGGVPPDVLTYLALAAGWAWAAFDPAWLAVRLSGTEWVLALMGRGARSAYRTTQHHTDGMPAPPGNTAPPRQGADTHYCWTCHQRRPDIAPGTSPAICTNCLRTAGQRGGEPLRRQWCDGCARFQPFTHRGCLRCWETGARS